MIRYALPLIAAGICVVPAHAAEVQMQVENPVVELSVTEIVRSDPDVAHIGAGVQTRAPTAQAALQQNARQMESLIARLRELGVERKDIQTANFSLNVQYSYNNDGSPPTFVGYDVSNQVSVNLRRLDRIGQVFDTLVEAGANNLSGPNFTLENDQAARKVAREAAFASGQAQAEDYARMAGYSGVRLLEVSESFQSMGPQPVSVQSMRADASEAATTPIESGQVGTAVNIVVKYEMTR